MFDHTGFAAGTGLRLVGAIMFALLAFGSVWLIESSGEPPAIMTSHSPTTIIRGQLLIESTFAVSRWTVQIQGRDVSPATSTPQRFEADLNGELATVFIQAEPADPTSSAAGALRWSFAGKSGILWGEGTVADTIQPPPSAGRSR